MIDARTKSAEDRGDFKTVQALKKARESVQKDATLPEEVKDANVLGAGKSYESALKVADQKLSAAYQRAIADYTKARQLDQAEAVQQEAGAAAANSGAGGSSADSTGSMTVDHQRLGGTRGVPGFLKMPDGAESTRDGLIFTNHDALVRTKDGDFLNRDFTFDVLLVTKEGDHQIAYFGVGEGSFEGGYAEPQKSVYLRVYPPDRDDGAVVLGKNVMDKAFDHVRNPGAHMLRIQKIGNALTFAIDIDYKAGAFKADISRNIPDIRSYAPFLHDRNMFIFFGRGGTFREVGLAKRPPQPPAAGVK